MCLGSKPSLPAFKNWGLCLFYTVPPVGKGRCWIAVINDSIVEIRWVGWNGILVGIPAVGIVWPEFWEWTYRVPEIVRGLTSLNFFIFFNSSNLEVWLVFFLLVLYKVWGRIYLRFYFNNQLCLCLIIKS